MAPDAVSAISTDQVYQSSKSQHVVVVHGTWGRGFWHSIRWRFLSKKQQESKSINWPLIDDLRKENIKVTPFNWSGKNSHKWRMQAGQQLVEYLKNAIQIEKQTSEEIILLGHSHGGNVILYAMKDPVIAEGISQCVFLSTPFLSVSSIKVAPNVFPQMQKYLDVVQELCVICFILSFLGSVGYIFYESFTKEQAFDPWWLIWFILPLAYGVLYYLAGYLSKGCERIQNRLKSGKTLEDSYQPNVPTSEKTTYIVRKTGDEATLFVNTGRALEVLMSWVWIGVHWLFKLPPFLISKIGNAAEMFRNRYPKWSLIPSLILFGLSLLLFNEEIARFSIIGLFILAGLSFLIGAGHIFLLMAMGGVHFCRFGTANRFSDLFFMEATTEATPIGSWQLHTYPGQKFRHSECYKDPDIREKILNAICGRA